MTVNSKLASRECYYYRNMNSVGQRKCR